MKKFVDRIASDDSCGWSGGFDLVLGNPPWDTLSPDAKEFFSRYDERVRFQSKGEQEITLSAMLQDVSIATAWAQNRRNLFATAFFLKESGQYTLFAPGNLGKGDFNVYRMFVELALRSVRDGGRAAQIVPEGLYSGANSMALRKKLFDSFRLDWLLGFENAKEIWFTSVDSRTKFTLYSAFRGGHTEEFRAAFCIRSPDELRAIMAEASMKLPVAMVREFSPDALAVMEFRGQRDIDIARKMYQHAPPLGLQIPGTPRREFLRELESGHVQELLTEDSSCLPHYEGRMIEQYDHRAKGYCSGRARSAVWAELPFGSADKGIKPQWYVPRDKIPAQARLRVDQYRAGFCDVASPTNERTLVATIIPPQSIAGDKVPTVLMRSPNPTADLLLWLAIANSFTMDFLVRMKVSLKMALTILDSLPFLRLSPDDARAKRLTAAALRLVCTGPEMIGLWNLMAAQGLVSEVSLEGPVPGIIDAEQRQNAIAEIEAEVAILYGLTAEDVAYIMETFLTVKRRDIAAHGDYRTKYLILDRYDRMQQAIIAGQPYETALDQPPSDARVAHPTRGPGVA